MRIKTALVFTLATLSGGILALILTQILIFVIGDIIIGALNGTPETGWGILISLYFLAPVAAVSFSIFYFSNKKFRELTRKPEWLILVSAALAAIGIVLAYIAYDKLKPQPEQQNKNDISNTHRLEDANNTITRHFRLQGELPSTLPSIKQDNAFNIYRIISKNTFELCGSFETDTIQSIYYYYSNDYINETNSAEKVKGKALMDPLEANKLFYYHYKGVHCYKIKIDPVK